MEAHCHTEAAPLFAHASWTNRFPVVGLEACPGYAHNTLHLNAPLQFHNSKIKFPMTYNLIRPSAPEFKSIYKAKRPTVAMK